MEAVAAETHAVDRDALRIWFGMFPQLIQELATNERQIQFFQLNGRFRLGDVADSSHRFLYGHRYWADVKRAAAQASGERWACIEAIAKASGAPREYGLAMAAIAQMTIEQCGTDFLSSEYIPPAPVDLLKHRAQPMRPSLLERLKGKSTTERVIFNENDPEGWFPILATQEITTAAELDKRPFHEKDARCYEGMGPIPVDCRSGSCGTCWIGILGGHENLEPIEEFEQKRMEYFGYWDSGFADGRLLRLACQTRVQGSVSIVIPPWNGVFGRTRREKELLD